MKGFSSSEAAAAVESASSLETNFNSIKDQGKACFEKLLPLKSTVFCYGCWAYGGQYFTDGPTFKFKTGSCNVAIEACAPVWNFITKTQSMSYFSELLTKITSPTTVSTKTKISFNPNSDINTVKALLEKCPTGKVENSCTQDDLDSLCNNFFNWAKAEPEGAPVTSNTLTTITRVLATASAEGSTIVDPTGGSIDLKVSGPVSPARQETATNSNSLISAFSISLLVLLAALNLN